MSSRKIALLAVALMGVLNAGAYAQAAARGSEASEIKVEAKKYEFNPKEIKVHQGDHVKLVITALDHKHGFKLEAFHINQVLKKGAPTTVEFVADKAGTFPFECSHFCGLGHERMKGRLVVEEAGK